MEAIPLTSLLPDGFDPTQYKVHFAVWNQIKHPIDVLATSQEEWHGWNSWRSATMTLRIGSSGGFGRFLNGDPHRRRTRTRWRYERT